MSRYENGSGRPPADGRFQKGRSGNPKGRPKRASAPARSAFGPLFEQMLSHDQEGQLDIEDALKLKTFELAIKGDNKARREVMKWIIEREEWIARNTPKPKNISVQYNFGNPQNANDALVLLGIATRGKGGLERFGMYDDHRLQAWAVQAALSRPGNRSLSAEEIGAINLFTDGSDTLRWPKSVDEGSR